MESTYIFDDEILILGGINIEDKENGSDLHGREYEDYMIELCGKNYVNTLRATQNDVTASDFEKRLNSDLYFGMNLKSDDKKNSRFEMEDLYLDFINSSNRELTIIMAYFTPIKNVLDEICNACDRGVKVTIILPEYANFQNDSNRKTAEKLLKECPDINIYLSPKMLHTKMLINENEVTFGSCNITKNLSISWMN